MEPLNTGNEFDDLQLFNFVIKPANLSLFQLDASPFIRIDFSHRFHDFDDFCSGSDSFLFQLQKSFVSCCACLIRILKNAVLSTPDASTAGMPISAAPATFLCRSASGDSFITASFAKPTKHLRHYITNQILVNRAH